MGFEQRVAGLLVEVVDGLPYYPTTLLPYYPLPTTYYATTHYPLAASY